MATPKTRNTPQTREVVLQDGKYRFWIDEAGQLRCDRYGVAWRDFIGDRAVHALFDEVIARAPESTAQSHWDEDLQFPVDDWRAEVRNDDTRLGYREWVVHQRELARNDVADLTSHSGPSV